MRSLQHVNVVLLPVNLDRDNVVGVRDRLLQKNTAAGAEWRKPDTRESDT